MKSGINFPLFLFIVTIFNFYVIFTTIIDDKFIYAIKDVTLEKDKIIKIESGELQSKTKEELIALINELE